MAESPLKPAISITLDKPRSLYYGNRALIALEKRTGKRVLDGGLLQLIAPESPAVPAVEDIYAFVWAGLLHEDPDLSFESVLDMVDLGKLGDVTEAIMQGLTQALPEPKEGEQGGPLEKRRSGANSRRSRASSSG